MATKIDFAKLLPIPKGMTVSGWAAEWLEEIAPLVQSVVSTSEPHKLRERNEKLSAYLSTLSVLRMSYQSKITEIKAKYAEDNPPPDKGIKAWEAALDAHLGDLKVTYDFFNDQYDVIAKRISVTQTNLRSLQPEYTSG